jgi:hypothetical protein
MRLSHNHPLSDGPSPENMREVLLLLHERKRWLRELVEAKRAQLETLDQTIEEFDLDE